MYIEGRMNLFYYAFICSIASNRRQDNILLDISIERYLVIKITMIHDSCSHDGV